MSSNDSYTLKSDFLDLLTILNYARLAIPISNPEQASEVVFKNFGISQAGEEFNKGWRIGIQESSNAKYLQAFSVGSLSFEEGTGVNRLILYSGDVMGAALWKNDVPDWFPAPNVIIYENIDKTLTRGLLKEYLDGNPKVFESITKDLADVDSTDTFLDKYFAMEISVLIPVQTGLRIGVAGTGTESDREINVYIQTELDDSLFIDPAIYMVHWENSFMDLQNHNLYASLRNMFGPLIVNGTIRYVGSAGMYTGDFLDPASPARDVASAVSIANDYDTILILDTGDINLGGRYIENLEIRKPLSITYLNPNHIDVTTLVSLETYNWPTLPILSGGTLGSVIEISEVDGYVSISNIIITGGGTFSSEKSYNVIGGGGVLAYYSDKTYIYNCLVIGNRVPIGSQLNGHGGGIYTYRSSSYIFKCNISQNETSERGGGIFVGPYSWPVIRQNVISFNQTTGVRADGGGIAAALAQPGAVTFDEFDLEQARNKCIRIIENQIFHNTAVDDGGGVYLSVMSKAIFKRNEISFNVAYKAGGGIRASLGSDLQMYGDSVHDNQASYLYSSDPEDLKNGGGGIAARNSDVILNDVTIANNTNHAFAGGGIYFGSSSEGDIDGLEESPEGWYMLLGLGIDSYDDILRDYYFKTEVRLEILGNTTITGNISSRFDTQTEDSRKGGGIYALRYLSDDFTALPLKILIGNFSCMANNRNDQVTHPEADHTGGSVATDPSGTATPAADQFYLYDMVGDYYPPEQHEPDIWIIDTQTVTGFLDDQNTFVWPPMDTP